ncbi:hypothetical protein LTR70_007503 [Exophiala xenobiotica]|uniref:EKC/KEOPS complex subunit GON7 n=1 Tax=Lithohypha guttulata TaxID=1690604 RepID=A0ABR0K3W5_9EURO|nr:hypothetical protein LTR24_007132 [Lithohypha guttulata]KAK5313662.1 hypothetical protein LTR70_007503 [Exophiala xenobiotica]
MSEEMNGTAPVSLRAVYNSPNDSKAFEKPLLSAKPIDTDSKVAFLSDLRASIKQLQDHVNTFLTAKMEDDKAASSSLADGGGIKKTNLRDEEEEEHYGEEKVDDE